MTLGEYIGALSSTDLFGENKAKFGQGLFEAAGSHVEVSEEAVKTWISGDRRCRVRRYFPDETIDETSFIRYFRQRTKAPDSWKKLQLAFQSMEPVDSVDEDSCVDLVTKDPDVFYWSLLNQFQRIFRLPESEREENDPTEPVTAPQQTELSPEQMRDMFLEAINQYKIMDIINREPAILNRHDAVCLNVFLEKMDMLTLNCNPLSSSLCASIKSFIDDLQLQVLSLDATLNNNFSFADENAAINMEGDEDLVTNTENVIRRLGIPELSAELIVDAADPVGLLKIAVEDWGNFRNKMNLLFKEISS